MTPEQKQQRLERIRKDADECYGFRNHTPAGHEPLIEKACDDIKLLLSLVSQEAAPTSDYVEILNGVIRRLKALRSSSLWNSNGYDAALSGLLNELRVYPDLARNLERALAEFVATVALAAGDSDAATSMRSACVEKVKALAESWAKSVNDQWDDRPDLSFDAAERLKAAGEIITALESVSIQEQEK